MNGYESLLSGCEDDKKGLHERDDEEIFYVIPNTQRHLEVQAKYIRKSDELQFIFYVEYNSVEVCWSRASPEERAKGEFAIEETEKDFDLGEKVFSPVFTPYNNFFFHCQTNTVSPQTWEAPLDPGSPFLTVTSATTPARATPSRDVPPFTSG